MGLKERKNYFLSITWYGYLHQPLFQMIFKADYYVRSVLSM